MKIERFIVVSTCPTKFIELERKAEGVLCWASDVDRLEAINAELLHALKEMVRATDGDTTFFRFMQKQRIAAITAIGRAEGLDAASDFTHQGKL